MKRSDRTGRVRFSVFEVDLGSGELYQEGSKIYLPEQPFQVLKALLEQPGEVVSREDLRQRLWPDKTFVDFEHGLNKAVARLRRSLGDDAERPTLVETLPKRGYRLLAKVEPPEGPVLAPAAHPVSSSRPPGRKAVGLAVLALGVLLGTGLYLLRGGRNPAETPPPAASIRALAVLPLQNLSGDAAHDYFADGMTDELIRVLARTGLFRVIARGSVMRYRGATRPASEIARDLEVDAVVVGSVRRSEDRVRVVTQLVLASSDSPVWSGEYERDGKDVLSLQSDLAREIVAHLGTGTVALDTIARPRPRSVNTQAFDDYLRGRYHWFKGRQEDLAQARSFFQKAIDADPAYAPPYAGLADYYLAGGVSGHWPASEAVPWGEVAAKKAQELDDLLPEAHTTLAALHLFYYWDWRGAEREAKRALELDPSMAEGRHLYAMVLGVLGRPDEALEQEKMSLRLDPFSRPWSLGRALLWAGKVDAAVDEFVRRVKTNPESHVLYDMLGFAYELKGMRSDAVRARVRALELGGELEAAAALERAYETGGYPEVHRLRLERLRTKAKRAYVSPLEFASASAASGDMEAAFAWLYEAYEQRAPRLVRLKQDPAFASLHADRRFHDLAARIGLPPS